MTLEAYNSENMAWARQGRSGNAPFCATGQLVDIVYIISGRL
jgi:hypothetical protein